MKKFLAIVLVLLAHYSFAQKVKVVEGDLAPLKGEKSLILKFTYNDMIVGKELTEEDYIARKKKEYNEKEPGRGEKWEKAWVADRQERFEPQFKELFEKHGPIRTFSNDAKYTLIFHTTRTEPGWNVGVMRAPARIDAEVFIVETANPSKVIAKITVVNAPGRDVAGFDFDTGYRIQEAYAKSGKEVGQLLTKAVR